LIGHVEFEDVEFEDVEAIAETALALLCVVEGERYWIPQAQISEDSEVYRKRHTGKLVISKWIAKQKGLI